MAVSETIQELLQGIDEAQYGRDMRQFIHKGIQKCYEEGSAGETDLVARQEIADMKTYLPAIKWHRYSIDADTLRWGTIAAGGSATYTHIVDLQSSIDGYTPAIVICESSDTSYYGLFSASAEVRNGNVLYIHINLYNNSSSGLEIANTLYVYVIALNTDSGVMF